MSFSLVDWVLGNESKDEMNKLIEENIKLKEENIKLQKFNEELITSNMTLTNKVNKLISISSTRHVWV